MHQRNTTLLRDGRPNGRGQLKLEAKRAWEQQLRKMPTRLLWLWLMLTMDGERIGSVETIGSLHVWGYDLKEKEISS